MKNFAKLAIAIIASSASVAALSAAAAQAAEPRSDSARDAALASQKAFEAQVARIRSALDVNVEIQGEGYLQVTDPTNGEPLFTRDGHLSVDSNCQLVAGDATSVYLLNPAITIPSSATKVIIGADGFVSVLESGAATMQQVGVIQLARFDNPDGLQRVGGGSFFRQTNTVGQITLGLAGAHGFGTFKPVRCEFKTSAE